MTEATPLASEQITQEDRDAAADLFAILPDFCKRDRGEVVQAFARHRIAALSATPAPSDQEASSAIRGEASFLCDRLREFERDLLDDDAGNQYHGHVTPSLERLEALLDAPSDQGVSGEVPAYVLQFLHAVSIAAGCKHPIDSYFPEDYDAEAERSLDPSWKIAERSGWVKVVGSHKWVLTDAGKAVINRPAPAPSCAPGGVERIAAAVEQCFEQTDAAQDIVEWTENGGGWKFARAAAHKIAKAVAALSPQGLDAATVERCAQIAETVPLEANCTHASEVQRRNHRAVTAAAIRALATEPHQHGGKA